MGPYCVLATVPVTVCVVSDAAADDDAAADVAADVDADDRALDADDDALALPAPSTLPRPAALFGPAASVGDGVLLGVPAAASATGWDLNASSAASPAAVLPMVMMARRIKPPEVQGWLR